MKDKARKVYERVYIHTAKVLATEGWVLVIQAMDAYSEAAFDTVFSKKPQVTTEVLDQLFDRIIKDYKPIFHLRQIILSPTSPSSAGCCYRKPKPPTTGLYTIRRPPSRPCKTYSAACRIKWFHFR